MSSILKALKKIEKEAVLGNGPAAGQAFDPRRALKRRIKPGWRKWPWAVVLIFLLAAVSVKMMYKDGRQEKKPLPEPAVTMEKKAPVTHAPTPPPAVTSPPETPPQPEKTEAPVTPPPARAPVPAPAEPPAASPQVQKAPEKPPVSPSGGKAPAARIGVSKKRLIEQQQKEQQDEKEQTASAPPAAAAGLSRLPADSGLTLQALAWAPEAENRFVVINGQIVREGENIGALKVERIEQENVLIRKGGELFRLK